MPLPTSPTLPAFPPGLPERITGASAWLGSDMAARSDWIEPLGAAELAELHAACRPWLTEGAELTALTPERFALPTLAPRIAALRKELLQGRGFALWRGLPVADWGRQRCAVAFYGLGTHLGQPLSQNAQGHVLGHVRDMGLSSTDPNVRIYQTRERQSFHTDSCDVVGLLCLQKARSGGESALVSSTTLYNILRAQRPDLAAALFQPLATDRRGEVPAGAKPYFEIPVFNWFADRLSVIYHRQYIDSAQRFEEAPRLSALQIEALDMLDALTNDPALNFMMQLEAGDMQFVHNHALLHDRMGFTDDAAPEQRRHLLRLWLAPAQARPLPPVFAQRYGNVAVGQRGGVPSADGRLRAPMAQVG